MAATSRDSARVEFLVNQHDAGLLRGVDVGEADILPVEPERADVRALHAREDFHQRRLAGAVLSDHRHDFPRRNVQADAIERLHTGKTFADGDRFQHGEATFECRGRESSVVAADVVR